MTLAGELLRLDGLDAAIEQREAELQSIRRRIMRNSDLEAARTREQRLRAEQATVAAESRALEAELADVESKIARDRKRMYSGVIVDSRELGSLERELTNYGERRSALEDRVLAVMDRLDGLAAGIAAAETYVAELQEQWDRDRPSLTRDGERLTTELAAVREQRAALAATFDARTLATYTRVRASGGRAVVPLRNGVCGHCRVTLPPKDIQHVRGGALVLCPNCGYILASDG